MNAASRVFAQDLPGPMQAGCTCPAGGATTMKRTSSTRTPAAQPGTPGPRRGFEHSEGLRALLIRLHEGGQWAWRHDPEVAALMQHAADKYAALARRHGLDPWEAAAAASAAPRTGAAPDFAALRASRRASRSARLVALRSARLSSPLANRPNSPRF